MVPASSPLGVEARLGPLPERGGVMLGRADRELLETWAEHGVPFDRSTVDYVQTIARRVLVELADLLAAVEELSKGEDS